MSGEEAPVPVHLKSVECGCVQGSAQDTWALKTSYVHDAGFVHRGIVLLEQVQACSFKEGDQLLF